MDINITKLGKLIENSKKILLINHIRMDMDALGSLSAMFDILSQKGKNIKAINDEKPIENYSFIGYNNIINPELDIKEFNPDLIISFDAASLSQLGKSYSENRDIFNKTTFIVIDHHKTNFGFGDINIIKPEYSSTCELVYDILLYLKLDNLIVPKIATSLLSGIYTDTNIFYNSNTTSNTYKVVSKLIEHGADFRKPYYEFYKKKTFSQSKLWGEILANNMKLSFNGKVISACIKKELFKKTSSNDRELTGLISEFFTNIDGVEIAFISFETKENTIKTSFRSTPDYDVSQIAQIFGGGGHKQAAGCSSSKSLKEVEIEILKEIKNQFN